MTLENKMILCFYIENLNNHQQDWKDERVEKNNICGNRQKSMMMKMVAIRSYRPSNVQPQKLRSKQKCEDVQAKKNEDYWDVIGTQIKM